MNVNSESYHALTIRIPKSEYFEDSDEPLIWAKTSENNLEQYNATYKVCAYVVSMIALGILSLSGIFMEEIYQDIDHRHALFCKTLYAVSASLLFTASCCGLLCVSGQNHQKTEKVFKIVIFTTSSLMVLPVVFFFMI